MLSVRDSGPAAQEERSVLAQWRLLLVVIAVTLLSQGTAGPPTTTHAAGATLPALGSCSSYAARPLATTLWYEPVSGAELIAALYGYYEGSHFCGALYAEAALTLPRGMTPSGSVSRCRREGRGPVATWVLARRRVSTPSSWRATTGWRTAIAGRRAYGGSSPRLSRPLPSVAKPQQIGSDEYSRLERLRQRPKKARSYHAPEG